MLFIFIPHLSLQLQIFCCGKDIRCYCHGSSPAYAYFLRGLLKEIEIENTVVANPGSTHKKGTQAPRKW